jgi:hypothetical protein
MAQDRRWGYDEVKQLELAARARRLSNVMFNTASPASEWHSRLSRFLQIESFVISGFWGDPRESCHTPVS